MPAWEVRGLLTTSPSGQTDRNAALDAAALYPLLQDEEAHSTELLINRSLSIDHALFVWGGIARLYPAAVFAMLYSLHPIYAIRVRGAMSRTHGISAPSGVAEVAEGALPWKSGPCSP